MVGLVTELDGLHFLLFHVEQQRQTTWHYRWRILPPCPAGYGEWREGSNVGQLVVLQPEIGRCQVEAQWRESAEAEWRQAALLTLQPPRLRFRVKAKGDVMIQKDSITAVASMGEAGVAAYHLAVPPYGLRLYEGEEASLKGRADSIHPANFLRIENEFRINDPLLEVVNASRSFEGWEWTPGPADCRLRPSEYRRSINYFALKAS
jgi:hypothetical protein